jgi:hypothetical protein
LTKLKAEQTQAKAKQANNKRSTPPMMADLMVQS